MQKRWWRYRYSTSTIGKNGKSLVFRRRLNATRCVLVEQRSVESHNESMPSQATNDNHGLSAELGRTCPIIVTPLGNPPPGDFILGA